MSQVVVSRPKLRRSGWFSDSVRPVLYDGLTKKNVELVEVRLPVKPSEKVPPVGASCVTRAEKSVVSLVVTCAPESCEAAGCSLCARVKAASASGSKIPMFEKRTYRDASAL